MGIKGVRPKCDSTALQATETRQSHQRLLMLVIFCFIYLFTYPDCVGLANCGS
jgi:hypothetical protein